MEYTFQQLAIAFGLSLFAGMSTTIGAVMAFFTKRSNTKFLSISLGFSAGVMIYVSFVEILAESFETLGEELGTGPGGWITILSFFGGVFLIGIIDRLIPAAENPHELEGIEKVKPNEPPHKQRLIRLSIFTALAVAIHNFPEGMASFTATLFDPSLGVAIAIAVAIHNIPEGIAVSVPVYYATGSRKKAFGLAFISGFAEPVGALLVWLILMPFMSAVMMGVIFAIIAGIMVFISLDELLPSAEQFGHHHLSIYGLIAGMAVMALSLQILH